jgi:glycosyltransferase involved in cell wall biosynthesis
MSHGPQFSVVVPCYRVAHRPALVNACVTSIARQTHTDFELLLVDDGSPDTSTDVLRGILAGNGPLQSRSRVIALAHNGGVCAARNAGIDAARGRHVAFLDFDDLWQPEFLSGVAQAIDQQPQSRVFLVRTDFARMLAGELRVAPGPDLARLNALDWHDFCGWHLTHNFPVAMGSAIVIERRLFDEEPALRFDLHLSRTTAEDVLLGFQLLERGIRPWYIERPLCMHRRDLAAESRSTAAFLRVDERAVNDYIAERATHVLVERLLAARPSWFAALDAQRRRLEREFSIKHEIGQRSQWFGLRRCLRDPRAFKPLVQQILLRMLWGGPFDGLLRRRQLRRGVRDAEAEQRVWRLLSSGSG